MVPSCPSQCITNSVFVRIHDCMRSGLDTTCIRQTRSWAMRTGAAAAVAAGAAVSPTCTRVAAASAPAAVHAAKGADTAWGQISGFGKTALRLTDSRGDLVKLKTCSDNTYAGVFLCKVFPGVSRFCVCRKPVFPGMRRVV